MNMRDVLLELGFTQQVGMSTAINTIDDRFGGGSGHRTAEGKSWGDVTEDDWSAEPDMKPVVSGTEAEILQAYTALRRCDVRGWLSITTRDWTTFMLWRPQKETT